MILLWLFCAGVTGQEPCSSPGDFPSPKLFLNTSSAQVGDSVSAQCSIRPYIVAALVIFCQDGKEISSQEVMRGQLLYQHDISVRSSGQFRCMYQYRNKQNQVKNSHLSLPWTLDVPGLLQPHSSPDPRPTMAVFLTIPQTHLWPHSRPGPNSWPPITAHRPTVTPGSWFPGVYGPGGRLGPEAIWGIAGLSVLCLAPLIYLLVKKVASKQRCPSEPFPNHSTENTPTEEQIQYAAIREFGAATIPREQENETVIYAIVEKVRDKPS
ncbi:hypothetical protein KIL84_002039 [Mauremys mutica]|uniref:Ig-like domain-containing protein n=1 Tax=Mauremys mutica TaxID=74926 RepID=A0A9D3XL23_9SAUR|nr:hypothetical protein KIL84_002039 [Mauremys mutica]